MPTTTASPPRWPGWLLVLAVILVLVGLPWITSGYTGRIIINACRNLVLALSFDIVGGYMGYINLGHASFFGLGAYAFAIATTRGLPIAPALLIAGLSGVALAMLVSYPLFRLRGVYFSIASFGLIVLLRQLALNLGD